MSTGNLSLDKKRKIKQKIEILRQDTHNVDLWLELESLFDDPDKKREILMGVLVIDAQNSEALERLSRLTGMDESTFTVPDSPEDQKTEQDFSAQKKKAFDGSNGGWQFEDSVISSQNADDDRVETRKCPFCGELISEDALECRFCFEYVGDGPQESHATTSQKDEEAEFSGWLKTAIIIFIVLGVITVLGMFIWMIIPLI